MGRGGKGSPRGHKEPGMGRDGGILTFRCSSTVTVEKDRAAGNSVFWDVEGVLPTGFGPVEQPRDCNTNCLKPVRDHS